MLDGHGAGVAGSDGWQHTDPGRRAEHADAARTRRQDQGAGGVLEQAHRGCAGAAYGEAGGPALEASTWILFLAPAGTPREIVNRMSAEAVKVVAAGEF